MKACSTVLLDRFIVIAADENQLAASGCSIDSCVRLVKALGQELGIDFFDRLNVYFVSENTVKRIPYHSMSELSGYYFDPLIQTLGELRNSWPVRNN